MAKKSSLIQFGGRTFETDIVSRHGNKTIRRATMRTEPARLVLTGDVEWSHKPSQDGRPEMYIGQDGSVQITLRDGMTPEILRENGGVGQVSIKVKEIIPRSGRTSQHLYLVVQPLRDGKPKVVITNLERPLKSHNPSADFWIKRPRNSQAITVRTMDGKPAHVNRRGRNVEKFPFAVITWNGEGRPDSDIAQLTRAVGDGAFSLQSEFRGRHLLLITVPGADTQVLDREVRQGLVAGTVKEGEIYDWVSPEA